MAVLCRYEGRLAAGFPNRAGPAILRSKLIQGIGPAEAGEAGEIAVCGMQHSARLNCQSGQFRIRYERSFCLTLDRYSSKGFPMILSMR